MNFPCEMFGVWGRLMQYSFKLGKCFVVLCEKITSYNHSFQVPCDHGQGYWGCSSSHWWLLPLRGCGPPHEPAHYIATTLKTSGTCILTRTPISFFTASKHQVHACILTRILSLYHPVSIHLASTCKTIIIIEREYWSRHTVRQMYAESDGLHHPHLDWSVGKFQAHDRYRKLRYSLHTSDTQYAYVLSIIIIYSWYLLCVTV